ncbi:NapC/NirT family cytochrome c [Marinifilum fragile]|uniref:NapC/NirT family cytochrome c n=1 Tax=Marinifilum fragile TaxID=570161 RepID=UPI002AA776D8|nr:NapC/NirT family cytochrome c [Marinifilum fragile]
MTILKKYKFLLFILTAFLFAFVFTASLKGIDKYTSNDQYCISCHVHTHADNSWRQASHYNNKSGVVVHCVDCHLPPKDHMNYWPEKIKAASKDLYSFYFTDHSKIDWEEKSMVKHAKNHTYNESCINCHDNLFPLHLSKKGDKAHLYYKNNQDKLNCINCHLDVGHGGKKMHKPNIAFLQKDKITEVFKEAANISNFEDFTEQIPDTDVSFEMVAIPKTDTIAPFFMGKIEVSWNEYKTFLEETESEGRIIENKEDVDAISGATPPFGDPSQGWGMGTRPAITMTWHAANTYCKWLSQKTGKTYRLPTKEEWIHACKANSTEDFFFGGKVKDYKKSKFPMSLFRSPNEKINEYVTWSENGNERTALPDQVKPNPFGLINMLGNVKEFCSDEININGTTEHVIMGGSFNSKIEDLLYHKVDHTQHEAWMITDPQIPKSIWWYSDCTDVGFRVVCEFPKKQSKRHE